MVEYNNAGLVESPDRKQKLARAILRTAPGLADALGGPLAASAVDLIGRIVLGKDIGADEKTIEQALENPSPEVLARLNEAEAAFTEAVLTQKIRSEEIAAGDRASARARQIALKDWTPALLGGVIISGFFLVMWAMMEEAIPPGAETQFSILLGALSTMTAAVVNYYFGSSAGSREKTGLLTALRK